MGGSMDSMVIWSPVSVAEAIEGSAVRYPAVTAVSGPAVVSTGVTGKLHEVMRIMKMNQENNLNKFFFISLSLINLNLFSLLHHIESISMGKKEPVDNFYDWFYSS
jgi:hypothetical protein